MILAEKALQVKKDIDDVYDKGIEQGKQAEYDAHWDGYQHKGTRDNYTGSFMGTGWRNAVFEPKYNMKPSTCYMMFRECEIEGDLVAILEGLGRTLDTSISNNFQYMFYAARRLTRVGVINLTSIAGEYNASYLFHNASALETIDLIIMPSRFIRFNMFNGCTSLKHIRVSGTIQGDVVMQECPLDLDSAKDIILHLKDLRDNGDYSLTLTLSDATWALLDADIGCDVNGDGTYYMPWRDYVTMNICWNI